jgi:hypothetical protein
MSVDYVPPVKKTTLLPLICDGQVHQLDIGDYVPMRAGLTLAHTYLNIPGNFVLDYPSKPGRLRIFMRRAEWQGGPVDDTYFRDLFLVRAGASLLDSRACFEWAEARRPLSWWYQTSGITSASLSTRFVKYAQVI